MEAKDPPILADKTSLSQISGNAASYDIAQKLTNGFDVSPDMSTSNTLDVAPLPGEVLDGNKGLFFQGDPMGGVPGEALNTQKLRYSFWTRCKYSFKHKKDWERVLIALGILLTAVILLIAGIHIVFNRSDQDVKNESPEINTLRSSTESEFSSTNPKDTLSVNVKLRAENSLVVAPIARPDDFSAGQLYFDEGDRSLYLHNGVSLRQFAFIDDINKAVAQIESAPGPRGKQGVAGKDGKGGADGLKGEKGASGVATCSYGNCLSLQSSLPGTQEIGNINISGDGSFGGNLSASSFLGNGAGLTAVDASSLQGQDGSYYLNLANSTGGLEDDRLSGNVVLENISNDFTASQTISVSGGKTTLQLTSSGADTGITFGGDTTLYRSAPNTIKTDDSVIIGGTSGDNSTTKLDIQNASGGSVLSVDTSHSRLEVVGDIYSKGTSWTGQTSSADNGWYSVTYGNGLFVAVANSGGTNNRVMTSPDGINWTTRTAPDGGWTSVTYGNGLFVAVKSSVINDNVMTSPDGINWTTRTVSPLGKNWYSVTYGNGLFVAVSYGGSGNSHVMTSPDGINWTIRTSANRNTWSSVTYGNGLFVAVASSGGTYGDVVMTSPDGINWTARTAASYNSWSSVTYGNGMFVAVSNSGTGNRVMTSPDGINWTSRSSATDNQWLGITYGNGLFVAVSYTGTGNRVMTSPDGINWTSRSSATDNQWRGVTYGNGMFVAVSSSGTGNRVMTSGRPELSVVSNNNIYQGGVRVNGSSIFTSGMNSATTFQIQDAGGTAALIISTNNVTGGANGANAVLTVAKDSGTNRSINAAGSINASGADYAEWVSWKGAKPSAGSIITYKGSDYVVSSPNTAAFIGNDNFYDNDGLLVTFAGQVPVRVKGVVRVGDLLVSNGDGTARAINPKTATLRDFMSKVAIAQEGNNQVGVKLVEASVGTNVSASHFR